MSLILCIVLSIFVFVFASFFVLQSKKRTALISSVAVSVGASLLVFLFTPRGQICLLILLIFLVSDLLLYAFSNSIENPEGIIQNSSKEKIYLTTMIWALLLAAIGLLYKFAFDQHQPWIKSENYLNAIHFKNVGYLLWGEYYFITILLSLILLTAGVGALMMVRAGESNN